MVRGPMERRNSDLGMHVGRHRRELSYEEAYTS